MKRADDTDIVDGPGPSKRIKTSDPTVMEVDADQSNSKVAMPDIKADTTTTLEPQDTEGENGTNRKKDKNISRRQAASFAKSETGKEKRKGKGKEGKGFRGRRGTRNEEAQEGETQAEGPKSVRFPKKMCALLIGFCGTGCKGMQMYVHIMYFTFRYVLMFFTSIKTKRLQDHRGCLV